MFITIYTIDVHRVNKWPKPPKGLLCFVQRMKLQVREVNLCQEVLSSAVWTSWFIFGRGKWKVSACPFSHHHDPQVWGVKQSTSFREHSQIKGKSRNQWLVGMITPHVPIKSFHDGETLILWDSTEMKSQPVVAGGAAYDSVDAKRHQSQHSRWNQHPPAETEGCFHGETHLDLHRRSRTWWIIDRYQALMLAQSSWSLTEAELTDARATSRQTHTARCENRRWMQTAVT